MNRFCFLTVLATLMGTSFGSSAFSQEIKNISEIGTHVKLFTFEKSENPQNILIGYTKLEPDCHFVREGQQALLDYYWMMDRKKYKPVHSLIKKEVRGRLAMAPSGAKAKDVVDQFALKVQNFKGLSSDLGKVVVNIKSVKEGGVCRAFAEVSEENLGASGSPAKAGFDPLRLQVIKAESEGSLLPPFRKFVSLTFSGTDVKTGAEEKQTIR